MAWRGSPMCFCVLAQIQKFKGRARVQTRTPQETSVSPGPISFEVRTVARHLLVDHCGLA